MTGPGNSRNNVVLLYCNACQVFRLQISINGLFLTERVALIVILGHDYSSVFVTGPSVAPSRPAPSRDGTSGFTVRGEMITRLNGSCLQLANFDTVRSLVDLCSSKHHSAIIRSFVRPSNFNDLLLFWLQLVVSVLKYLQWNIQLETDQKIFLCSFTQLSA